jgi:CubicO group peptidase (beta-lactamase class C family)
LSDQTLRFASANKASMKDLLYGEFFLSTEMTIGSVRQIYDGTLLPDAQVNTFRNIDRLFPTRTVPYGSHVQQLPVGSGFPPFVFRSKGEDYDLYDYLSLNRISGLLVLKNGEVRLETYQLGNDSTSKWMSMSVAKSVTSTLAGIALNEGAIQSLEDEVVRYVPSLKGSSYEGVSIRNVLQMASGVAWNEDYLDPHSDRRRMLDAQIAQRSGGVLELMAALPRAAAPGQKWNYSTGETHVLGAIVRGATGMPLSQYLSEKVWIPCGMESTATWWLESKNGLEVGGSGLSATLRDYGRFGQFLMSGGMVGGIRMLPAEWLDEASTPKIFGGDEIDYGYMLWPIAPSASHLPLSRGFEARGIFGQHIYMNPSEEIVIVVWGALPKPQHKAPIVDHDFFRAVTHTLR